MNISQAKIGAKVRIVDVPYNVSPEAGELYLFKEGIITSKCFLVTGELYVRGLPNRLVRGPAFEVTVPGMPTKYYYHLQCLESLAGFGAWYRNHNGAK